MKAQYNLRAIGIACLLTILFCIGILLYSLWDYQRFVASLGEVPKVSPLTASQEIQPITVATGESELSQEQTLEPIDAEAYLYVGNPDSELLTPEVETDKSKLTEFMLFLDEHEELEVSSLSDNEVSDTEAGNIESENICTDVDHRTDAEALQNRYGDSPDVEILIEVNRLLDDGVATTDDMIDRAEAWLKLLPEDDYRNRQEATDSLKNLYQTKADTEAGIVIETIYYRIPYF